MQPLCLLTRDEAQSATPFNPQGKSPVARMLLRIRKQVAEKSRSSAGCDNHSELVCEEILSRWDVGHGEVDE